MVWPESWKQHLKVKLQTLGLLLLAGALVAGVFWLVFQILLPFLPETLQLRLQLWESQPMEVSLQSLKLELENHPQLPLLFVGIQFGQVVLAPIPGQLMGLLGGWLFGFWGGLSLTMLGLTAGSFLAMLIGRYGGRWLIDRLLSHELLLRFDHMVESSGLFTFFMLFLLPALPDDALCLVAGMTPLRIPLLLGACLLGRLPGMAVLTWVGAGLEHPHWVMQALLVVLGILSFVFWLFQDPIEQAFSGWSHKRHHQANDKTKSDSNLN